MICFGESVCNILFFFLRFKVKPHKLSTQSSSEMSEGEFTLDGELAGEETANGTAGGETLPVRPSHIIVTLKHSIQI